MDDKIVATFCLCDDLLKAIHHHMDKQCQMNDAEVMTTALVAALFFRGKHESARALLKEYGSLPDTFITHFDVDIERRVSHRIQPLKYPSNQGVYAMSDNLRRYRAIRQALTQWYPGEPSGRLAQHLTSLAAFMSGIVGSKSSQLPSIATKVPDRAKPESRVKRLSRWLDNAAILEEVYFLPYADMLLKQLALETLVLVMDGSGVGRGCCALMMHVIYKGRALPLVWRVRQCPKGHFPEDLHIALVALVSTLIPEGTRVVFLGDGEFDGIRLQKTMNELGWWYACRTSKGNTVTWQDETFAVEELGACIKPGRLIELKDVAVTREAYGPVLLLCCWAKGYAEPLYVVSNMSSAEEAIEYYQKRFRIETFFSDQKSRGFHIQQSHITDPQRLSRLLIASCLAYIWVVYLGSLCQKDGWQSIIHRKKRCD